MIKYKTIKLGLKQYLVGSDGSIFDIKKSKMQKIHIMKGYYAFHYPISYNPSKFSQIKVHKVVAITFLNHTPCGNKIQIDHINGNKLDNRVQNLRQVSTRQNQSNRICHRNGKLVGCYYDKVHKYWVSRIGINKKYKVIGTYRTQIEAHESYMIQRQINFPLEIGVCYG